MTVADPQPDDPHRLGRSSGYEDLSQPNGARGPAPTRIIVAYGFWIFLLSDIIMFAGFFASYAVLLKQTAGGPTGRDLFDLNTVAIETACLLASSFTCGLASVAANGRNGWWFFVAMAATFVLGASFLGLEVQEFKRLIAIGAGPSRSAFLSAFFTLVGCHGVHIAAGLLWLLTMMAQVLTKGFRENILHRILCFSLFWHALDIVWIGLFTTVYMIGVVS